MKIIDPQLTAKLVKAAEMATDCRGRICPCELKIHCTIAERHLAIALAGLTAATPIAVVRLEDAEKALRHLAALLLGPIAHKGIEDDTIAALRAAAEKESE